MEIREVETDTKGSFSIEIDGKKAAEMTYSKAGLDRIIVDHTEVGDTYRGTGLGLKLVAHAVEFVRDRKLKMLPLCPFTKATLLRHPEWNDIW